MSSKTIKQLDKIEQPRAKFERYGADKLSMEELLAIVLRTGKKGKNVLEISKEIAKYIRSDIDNLSIENLKKINGIGMVKAIEILSCIEIGKRIFLNKHDTLILKPEDVWHQCQDIKDSKKENFVCFFLDTRSREIKREIISVGTIESSLAHPREVFEPAVRHLASQIIIAHNHPSGNLEPSSSDLLTTDRIKKAGEILGITLADHVIISKNGYFSLKEGGML